MDKLLQDSQKLRALLREIEESFNATGDDGQANLTTPYRAACTVLVPPWMSIISAASGISSFKGQISANPRTIAALPS
ncbi:hypothetical protein [Stutzerimonas stutzeri]|uniref:hypothetical protein n=1 Tax=Stutzerimonas stutzeri TaxID=316 RepID=UPI0015E2B8EE|nr:hypothetical protein [Stutzerimonas stutzeri]MBA1280257.1 hypothetical protein [Stutzerimonas stutzeri]